MTTDREAALAEVYDIFADPSVEAPSEEASSSDDSAAEEETPQKAEQQEEEEFNLDPEVPDEIRALVDEPDFEAEAEEELEASVEEEWDEEGEEYTDPRLAEERKKRVAAEKKAAHYENLRVKDARKSWEEEAEKFYPLADAKKIDATSRRGFLRTAKNQHEAMKPFVLKGIETYKAELQADFDKKLAEKQAELEAAWGKPLAGSAQTPAVGPGKKQDIDAAWKKSPAAGIRAMLEHGE